MTNKEAIENLILKDIKINGKPRRIKAFMDALDMAEKSLSKVDSDFDVEELSAYVCDKLCRHSHNKDLHQDALDGICSQCKITKIMQSADLKQLPYQKPKVLARGDLIQNITCRNFITGKFIEIK